MTVWTYSYLVHLSPALSAAGPAPESLHPSLWRAHQLGRAATSVQASGFAELDAQLPGGGWPVGAVTELLLPHPGVGEWRLLAPALVALQARQRCVLCLAPPAAPCAWALRALGVDLQRLVLVQAGGGPPGGTAGCGRVPPPAADLLWALEQSLKSGHLGAVLAWLPPGLPPDALRRLQLAAQSHPGPAFLLRHAALRQQPSAAPLRLALGSSGPDALQVVLLKRRGPPAAQPLRLALPPVLAPVLRSRPPVPDALAGPASAAAVAGSGLRHAARG